MVNSRDIAGDEEEEEKKKSEQKKKKKKTNNNNNNKNQSQYADTEPYYGPSADPITPGACSSGLELQTPGKAGIEPRRGYLASRLTKRLTHHGSDFKC